MLKCVSCGFLRLWAGWGEKSQMKINFQQFAISGNAIWTSRRPHARIWDACAKLCLVLASSQLCWSFKITWQKLETRFDENTLNMIMPRVRRLRLVTYALIVLNEVEQRILVLCKAQGLGGYLKYTTYTRWSLCFIKIKSYYSFYNFIARNSQALNCSCARGQQKLLSNFWS